MLLSEERLLASMPWYISARALLLIGRSSAVNTIFLPNREQIIIHLCRSNSIFRISLRQQCQSRYKKSIARNADCSNQLFRTIFVEARVMYCRSCLMASTQGICLGRAQDRCLQRIFLIGFRSRLHSTSSSKNENVLSSPLATHSQDLCAQTNHLVSDRKS